LNELLVQGLQFELLPRPALFLRLIGGERAILFEREKRAEAQHKRRHSTAETIETQSTCKPSSVITGPAAAQKSDASCAVR
jgi:hypothetical protein